MPNRILREGVCSSERMDLVSVDAEVFFFRLLVNVDDYGRQEARPAVLRAKCYPTRLDAVRDENITAWLEALARAGLVTLYSVGGKNYLQIERMDPPRAKHSKFPSPNDSRPAKVTDSVPSSTADDDTREHVRADADTCDQTQANVPLSLSLSNSISNPISTSGGGDASLPASPAAPAPEDWSAGLSDIRDALTRLTAPPEFNDPPYWQRIDQWLGAANSGVAYLAEFRKFLAWHDSLPKTRKKKNLRQAFRNWLAKAEAWSENRAQRQAVRSSEFPGAGRR